MKQTLPITNNREFAKIYKRGRYIPGRYVVLHYLKNRSETNRLGVTTGKKIKGSVSRNRMRRLLRETYRLREEDIKTGYDIILLGRDNPEGLKLEKVDKDVVYLFKKAGLWSDNHGL